MSVRLMLGDCLEKMAEIEDQSIDCIITDPPYPCVTRPYGRMTEPGWHAMMRGVVAHCRRILKSTGSAVFVLQPNSERAGRMRPWLFEFQAWACREWNMVQDAWWWNTSALTVGGSTCHGLLRPSLKACVWLGPPGCYRDQAAVLWSESHRSAASRASGRCGRAKSPSGHRVDYAAMGAPAVDRGGVTPFNVIPLRNATARDSASAHAHPGMTPPPLADWWVRYISPPDGTVCDPFMGSGTTGLAALERGRSFFGIEDHEPYFRVAERRIAAAQAAMPLFPATA